MFKDAPILGKGIALNREREPVGCAWVLEPQML